jgi:hypothetical protein
MEAIQTTSKLLNCHILSSMLTKFVIRPHIVAQAPSAD